MIHRGLIVMPWPDGALWQNRRVHWTKRNSATKKARNMAAWQAVEAGLHLHRDTCPRLVFLFHPPDRRARDMQNMPATQKAAIDGIADAMKVDDSKFRCAWPESFSKIEKGGKVVIEVIVGGIMREEILELLRVQDGLTAFEISYLKEWDERQTQRVLHQMDDDGDVIMRSGIYRISARALLQK